MPLTRDGRTMEPIVTEDAPKPAGHYAQGVVHGGLVYVSGQVPIDPKSGKLTLDTIEAQTQQALENVKGIVEAAGSRLDLVLKTTVYISDIELWTRVNEVYAAFFGDHRPARAIVPTKDLHFGIQVEIEAVAAIAEA